MSSEVYLRRIKKMSESQLTDELEIILKMRSEGYAMLNGRDCFNILVEASIKLCDERIGAIKQEVEKRKIKQNKE